MNYSLRQPSRSKTYIISFGVVLTLIAVTIAATAGISNSEQGMASGLLNTSQEVGAALGQFSSVGGFQRSNRSSHG